MFLIKFRNKMSQNNFIIHQEIKKLKNKIKMKKIFIKGYKIYIIYANLKTIKVKFIIQIKLQ